MIRVGRDLGRAEVLEQAAQRAPGHQPREQEVDRQRDPDREDVEDESAGEPAHVRSSEGRPAGGTCAARRRSFSTLALRSGLPSGQNGVKERMLSGKVVKIGSPKKFFFVQKQWKYFVL